MLMAARILIVDDEPPIIDLLTYNLKRANYEVMIARDGQQAVEQARRTPPDLIILDLMLPVMDGWEVFRILRQERDVPIIMLTALDEEIDRVVGLELGADDYVIKPFSVRELLARVKNVLRRAAAVEEKNPPTLLTVDAERYEACIGAVRLDLTTLEFELLRFLHSHPGRVFSREHLLEQVWGYDFPGDVRVVDAAVKRLRMKLAQAVPDTEWIQTVRGIGYKLVDKPDV